MVAKKKKSDAYAVIETGGKQYRVKKNDVLQVERLDAEIGQTVELQPVLAVSDGKKLHMGDPAVVKSSVKADVVEHIRGKKVINFKKKRRKGYSRKRGHRQDLTVLKVTEIA